MHVVYSLHSPPYHQSQFEQSDRLQGVSNWHEILGAVIEIWNLKYWAIGVIQITYINLWKLPSQVLQALPLLAWNFQRNLEISEIFEILEEI